MSGESDIEAEVVTMSDNTGGNNSDNGDNSDNANNVDDGSDDEPLPGVNVCIHCGREIVDGHCPNCEGAIDTEQSDNDQLPESTSVDEDPVNWMPKHFVDEIDGEPAINRKGYAVLAEHYDISVTSEAVTYPSDSMFEYAEFEATAITADGQEYSGFGSAHIERGEQGDDKTLLGEMAETRAVKRALALATGVGMTAIEELQSSVGGDGHE